MKRPRKITDWIGVAVALAACAGAVIFFGWGLTGCARKQTLDAERIIVNYGSVTNQVSEIRLSDGTRCAVLTGMSKGAIDCEWREARPAPDPAR